MSANTSVLLEQHGQANLSTSDAEVSFDGIGGSLGGYSFFGSDPDDSPASIAEREMLLKAQDKAAVSEPGAFVRYAGGRPEHWCAHFVSWLHAQSGQPLPGWKPPSPSYFPRHAGCTWLWNMLTPKGFTHQGTPRRNDMIFYKHSDPKYASGHIGLVTEVKNGKVTSIEGNLTPGGGRPDTIAKVTRPLTSSRILGYGRFYQPKSMTVPVIGAVAGLGALGLTLFLLRKR
jgi:hypothetical protein